MKNEMKKEIIKSRTMNEEKNSTPASWPQRKDKQLVCLIFSHLARRSRVLQWAGYVGFCSIKSPPKIRCRGISELQGIMKNDSKEASSSKIIGNLEEEREREGGKEKEEKETC